MKGFMSRTVVWVYKAKSIKTGEIITILSRKYMIEIFTTLINAYYEELECVEYFGPDKVFINFNSRARV